MRSFRVKLMFRDILMKYVCYTTFLGCSHKAIEIFKNQAGYFDEDAEMA
jgi:hypothetical protein